MGYSAPSWERAITQTWFICLRQFVAWQEPTAWDSFEKQTIIRVSQFHLLWRAMTSLQFVHFDGTPLHKSNMARVSFESWLAPPCVQSQDTFSLHSLWWFITRQERTVLKGSSAPPYVESHDTSFIHYLPQHVTRQEQYCSSPFPKVGQLHLVVWRGMTPFQIVHFDSTVSFPLCG